MTRIQKHLSPALVLSVMAIFIAMGGGAWAALGKNSVGSKQIKKNAVVTSKIKNNAVTSAKIKSNAITTAKITNNSVTGAKVDESSLGTVPNAANADKTTGYRTFPQTRYTATSGATQAAALAAAPENLMFTAGPVTIYSKCATDTSGPRTYVYVYAKTSENGVIFDSDDDEKDGDLTFLDIATLETERELLDTSANANNASVDMDSSYASTFMTPGGLSFEMQPAIAVKNGTLAGGNGLYGAGDACLVTGSLVEHNG